VIVGDTVGFIRDLPHELIAAFRATLEEVADADLLLHVIDASAVLEDQAQRIEAVTEVIQQLGGAHLPVIEVYNKIDSLPALPATVGAAADGARVYLSAREGLGLDALQQAIASRLEGPRVCRWLNLPARAGALRAWLYDQGAVQEERAEEGGGWLLNVTVSPLALRRLARFDALEPACGAPAGPL
jgi:GTP-binding protein HflX